MITLIIFKLYRRFVSPILLLVSGPGSGCRYIPSCSQYAEEAIEKYGLVRGMLRALKRIFTCSPLSEGGYDPV